MLTHFSLFSGIGGFDLAAELIGFTTVGQCEWADYPTKVLEKHWPEVPRWRDIKSVTAESFYNKTGLRTVTVISGGFPCQPFSVAGNQKGKGDDRYLWPEMLRVIRELTPRWVIGENVPGILSIAADDVCKDLEREGYEVGIFDFEAAAVGANHRRERVFFVGYSKRQGRAGADRIQKSAVFTESSTDVADTKHNGFPAAKITGGVNQRGDNSKTWQNATIKPAGCDSCGAGDYDVANPDSEWQLQQEGRFEEFRERSSNVCEDVADTDSAGLEKLDTPDQPEGQGHDTWRTIENVYNANSRGCNRDDWREYALKFEKRCWWSTEPDVGRVANGIPNRVDRIRCLGNAVVPQQAYPIFQAIALSELLS